MSFSSKNKFQNEEEIARFLLSQAAFLQEPSIAQNTETLIQLCRANKKKTHQARCFHGRVRAI